MATFSRGATLDWSGDIPRGIGAVTAGSGAFTVGATSPRLEGDPPPAPSTVWAVIGASLLLDAALSWSFIEPSIVRALE